MNGKLFVGVKGFTPDTCPELIERVGEN